MQRRGRWLSNISLLVLLVILIPATSIAESSFAQNSPQFRDVAQDERGNLHAFWVSEDGAVSRLYYQVRSASGQPLINPLLLSETTSRIRRPKVAIDGLNVVHLLWQERFAEGAGQKIAQGTTIHYAKLGLTPRGVVSILKRPLTLNTADSQKAASHPSLTADRAGWAYVTWEEGRRNVILTAIDPSGKIEQTRQISRRASETDHAEPAVAVDRRGNVHVVWTTQAGDKTQIVYKVLRGHGGRVLSKEKIVYATKGSFAQTKVVTFDKQGNAKIAWVNLPGRQAGQRARWAMPGMNAGSGYVVVRAGGSSAANSGSVVTVVDQSVQALPDSNRPSANDAALNQKQRLDIPKQAVERTAVTDPPMLSQSFSDLSVSKLLMERMLRYSSWSAPPPANSLSVYTRLVSYPAILSLSNTYLTASKTSLTQTVLRSCPRQDASFYHLVALEDHRTIQPSATRGGGAKSVSSLSVLQCYVVIASVAKQSPRCSRDCFVANAPRNDTVFVTFVSRNLSI